MAVAGVISNGAKGPTGGSLRAYARHRGVSLPAVQKAIRAKRLVDAVARDQAGRVTGVTDFAAADREWDANTDAGKAGAEGLKKAAVGVTTERVTTQVTTAPPVTTQTLAASRQPVGQPPARRVPPAAAGGGTFLDASTREKGAKASLAELEFAERSKQLVSRAAVIAAVEELVTRSKTRLFGLPSRFKAERPGTAPTDIKLLDKEVRRIGDDLAAEGQALLDKLLGADR